MRPRSLAALILREWRTSWDDRGACILRGAYASALLAGALAAWAILAIFYADAPGQVPELVRTFIGHFVRAQFVLGTLLGSMTFARAVCREQERGTLDFLILSPVSRFEILLGKVAGEFLGLASLAASGIPVLFVLLPLGGVSAAQILSFEATILAQVLLTGGVCVSLAAGLGKTTLVMGTSCIVMAGVALAPWAGPWWLPSGSRFWSLCDSLSIYSAIERELSSVWPAPALAGSALGFAAAAAILFCGLGSLVLERRAVRAPRESILAVFLRRLARAPGGERWFRHLIRMDHPLLRREFALLRDLPFRAGCVVLLAGYVGVARFLAKGGVIDFSTQILLASLALGMGSTLAVLTGALSVGYDRRRGTLQTLLAAGIEPADLVRARLAGMAWKAAYLLAVPALHLSSMLIVSRAFPRAELAWRIPAGLAALALATLLMMAITLRAGMTYRRPEVSAAVSVFLAVPTGTLVLALAAGTVPIYAIGFPLLVALLKGYYARLVLKAPKLILG